MLTAKAFAFLVLSNRHIYGRKPSSIEISLYSQCCVSIPSDSSRNRQTCRVTCFFVIALTTEEEKRLNRKKDTIMEYLALISIKNGLYLSEVFQAIVTARQKKKSKCQSLTIDYRGSNKKEAIFLITKDSSVIAQFAVEEEVLLRKVISFDSWMNTKKVRQQINKKSSPKTPIKIQNMRHGMKKISVQAQVIETPTPSIVQTRYGNSARVTNVWISDESGKIKLCLWNEQIDMVNAGDTVQIKNASVWTFKGEKQLRVGKKGTIDVLEAPPYQLS